MHAHLDASGVLSLGGERFRAAFGRGGIRADKQERDGATPLGLLPLRHVFFRADRMAKPVAMVPIEPLAQEDGWCDDPRHRAYNTRVRLPSEARCESLWREDRLYDVVAVLGWNDRPVVRDRGSAIFLHVATRDYAPTDGCIALAPADLVRALAAGLTGIDVGS